MPFSPMQREYLENATHRYNVKTGATGSGKTYLDILYTIPKRIRARIGMPGLVALIGNTRGTLQRNIIEPMREIWGGELVGSLRADNTAMLFGQRCHCLGADSKRQVARLQGATLKYAYGDEVTTWEPEVFTMLKSRLRTPVSVFDGTCNPAHPEHWFKQFLDGGSDIYQQAYALDDNPFLDPETVAQLKRDYAGTMYYDRYILGRWARAEGLVFPGFACDPGPYITDGPMAWNAQGKLKEPFTRVAIGIDFGGNGSQTCFCAVGYHGCQRLHVFAEDALPLGHAIGAEDICARFVDFYKRVRERAGRADWVLPDSAAPTLINSLRATARAAGIPARGIKGCRKNPVSQRPLTVDRLLAQGRLTFGADCVETVRALRSLRWSAKRPDEPEDQNEGNINDRWDAFCYAWLDFVEWIDREGRGSG